MGQAIHFPIETPQPGKHRHQNIILRRRHPLSQNPTNTLLAANPPWQCPTFTSFALLSSTNGPFLQRGPKQDNLAFQIVRFIRLWLMGRDQASLYGHRNWRVVIGIATPTSWQNVQKPFLKGNKNHGKEIQLWMSPGVSLFTDQKFPKHHKRHPQTNDHRNALIARKLQQ